MAAELEKQGPSAKQDEGHLCIGQGLLESFGYRCASGRAAEGAVSREARMLRGMMWSGISQ